MNKDVLFYNDLGRQGKSTLAYNFYDFQRQKNIIGKYVTNDIVNISFPIKNLVGEKNIISITAGEEVSIDTDDFNIFDFGGYLDNRVVSVTKHVKYIVMPISYASNSELKITAKTIKGLIKYNPNIVVVFNKTKKTKINRGMEMLNLLFEAHDIDTKNIKIFVVNESEYMTRLSDLEQSIFDVANASKGDKAQLNKNVIPQLTNIYNYLTI
ncbi:conserved hypothetical protein [Bathymodiolus platifrons methanotrophic gill symbiont]|uniref:hypothetical protein n=1 Tax=Bathymodiolus platifrons methanotrophic gill symbiont TaxID=113268 RepID=UPI000B419BB7|nr:hypothetical protein [Bathymodiolus platifrons methanotrophic gill symbiont]GAW87618.1 conserved hypothetical protein [Bathymodiolus platifrons methanotrophic gill symbiont]GFO77787.1 hypothetical protein BPLS_P6434 [Bathymodiolus platifrons methanotrophic gill symbiont]